FNKNIDIICSNNLILRHLVNIYIYGSDAFKHKIHTVLDHGNIRFKIEDGKVITIYNLSELKNFIKEDPHQIFLIDQDKIIEEDFITKYLKFLIPKDGIEKKFLDQYGVGDISFRSYNDLIVYLEKRLESSVKTRPKAHEITSIDDMFDVFEDEIKTEEKDITDVTIDEPKKD
ncbi:MAG: hypothetical protein U9R39_01790, partial [Campylobacterota bacterium]|nr:hypothetical protein [Campylobacterota bacterium]